jgi:hypothetical protein
MFTKIHNDEKITIKQGYEAMLSMLKNYLELTDSNEITDILSGGCYLLAEDTPADISFFLYWEEAVEQVIRDGSPPLNTLTK